MTVRKLESSWKLHENIKEEMSRARTEDGVFVEVSVKTSHESGVVREIRAVALDHVVESVVPLSETEQRELSEGTRDVWSVFHERAARFGSRFLMLPSGQVASRS